MTTSKEIVHSVSDAEMEVLQKLWEESPLTAQEIIHRLEGHPSTVKTLINRLLKKGALGFHEQNRKYNYYPVISRDEFYQLKTESFINRFFDGEVAPLVSFFSSHKKLDDREIAELKQLVEKLETKDEN